MSDFPHIPVGSVMKVQGGFAFKSKDFRDTGVPVLKIKNIKHRDIDTLEVDFVSPTIANETSKFYAKPGDVLISMTGSGIHAPDSIVGRVARFTGPNNTYLINQRVGRFLIQDEKRLDLRFLCYFFSQRITQWELVSIATGSANQVNISRNDIESMMIPLPPLPEQKAIAHILGTMDDKIELNRRINQTLEAMAQAIFKSWFVDFDPVRAKAAGRQPYGMDTDTATLFPYRLVDSGTGLGMIPDGWKVGRLSQIATLEMQPTSPSTYPSKIWEHYSIPAYDKGRQPALELGEDIKSGKYVVPEYCVLASKLNPQFPRVWLPDIQDTDSAICSTEFMPFIPNDTGWRPYLYEMLQSDTVQSEILNRATGSTGSRQRVKPKEIAVIPCIVPPKALIDFFCTKASSLHDKQLSNARQNGTLASLRDTLLPKLLSGEVRVRDVEKMVEGV